MKQRVAAIVSSTVVLAVAVAAGRQASVRIEGKFASNDLLVKGGKTYVSLSDVAKALGMTVQKTAGGYDLVKAGGANQVEGVNGKIGDVLFNGKYRFKVVRIIRSSDYKPIFTNPGFNFTASSESNEVVGVVCQIKNGTKESQMVDITTGKNTALTDQEEHSYDCFKGAQIDMANRAPKLLPGAAVDFALTFEVPKSAELKDLVYTINDFSNNPGSDFRVSLKQ